MGGLPKSMNHNLIVTSLDVLCTNKDKATMARHWLETRFVHTVSTQATQARPSRILAHQGLDTIDTLSTLSTHYRQCRPTIDTRSTVARN